MPTIGVDIRVLGTGRTSGVEEYTEQLLAHMVPLDPNIHYKLFYAGRRALERRPWMDAPNVSVYDTGISNRLLWARTRLTGRPYLDQLVGGAGVFFFPHFLVGATSPQCRRVLTMHDLSFEHFPELFSLGRRFWHRFQMRPRAQARTADRIIAVSESTRRDVIAHYGIEPERIHTIHSGIDPALGPGLQIASGRSILVLGTIEPRKNIEGVIAAFEKLGRQFEDVRLIIAGPRGWLYRDIMRRAERSPRRERIEFRESIRPEDRAHLFSQATVLAYPSLMEGFGFPPLEAMACGTPVIIGANSSMLQVCEGAALAVNPYSVSELSSALSSLLSDQSLRQLLVARGHRRVEQFSWHRTAEQTLQVMLQ